MGVAERFAGANRIDAGRLSPYWGEHAARYRFALEYVADKTVLDIACGTGYGIAILRGRAKYVTGVDVDVVAAAEAKSECGSKASVLLGNGLGLPFADNSFDVITSFETLEHLHERRQFLAELSRVLRPAGKLILSTPNANYTMPVNGKPTNPFHIFEYSPAELKAELESVFVLDKFLGQRLDTRIKIPPFEDAQKRLPTDVATRARLFAWKVMNKLPFAIRERLSDAMWHKPFYPTENDYRFSTEPIDTAPVLVAICSKKTL